MGRGRNRVNVGDSNLPQSSDEMIEQELGGIPMSVGVYGIHPLGIPGGRQRLRRFCHTMLVLVDHFSRVILGRSFSLPGCAA